MGDMIRIGDYHTVVVLEKKENSVMVTEGNYNSSIHWGREITRSSLEREASPCAPATRHNEQERRPGGPPLLRLSIDPPVKGVGGKIV